MEKQDFSRKKLSPWLKSLLLMMTSALLTLDYSFGQAVLPFLYDEGNPVSVNGLEAFGLGDDYPSFPKMKFDGTGDYLILYFDEAPGILSFDIEWYSGGSSSFSGIFTVYESDNGSSDSYTTVQTYNSTSETVLANTKIITESFSILKSTTRYIKWEYTEKAIGNIALGNIKLDKFLPVYTIRYSIYGFISAEESNIQKGNSIGNFPITPAESDCDNKKIFVGWVEQPVSGSTDAAPAFITEDYLPDGDKTLYAVFATENVTENAEWRALNNLSEVTEGTYVITFKNDDSGVHYYLPSETYCTTTNVNPLAVAGLTISSSKLTNTINSDMQWDFSGNNTDGFTVSHTANTNKYFLKSTDASQGILIIDGETTNWWKAEYNNTYGILLKGNDGGSRCLAVYLQGNASWRYYPTGGYYKGKLTLYKKTFPVFYSGYVTDCFVATWNSTTSNDWNTEANWIPNQIPNAATDVIIPESSVYPVVPEATTVNTITFKPGAEIGNQQNLTITDKAFVELELTPGRWHLLSMPVPAKSGDFYFEGGPNSWLRTFITTNNQAVWKYITDLGKQFDIGDGFAFWVAGSENQKITLEGTALAGAFLSESLDFGADLSSCFALAGNPFMTTIDFDKLQVANTGLNSSYLIWTGNGFSGYNKSGIFGTVTINGGLDKYIAPLQSFIVEKTDDGSMNLNFSLATVSANSTGKGTLKADENIGNKLDIIANNPTASVLTFIADREGGQTSRKLLSAMSNVPDIYTLNGATALGANIIQTDNILIPIGLATAYTGNINLTFRGMDSYDAQISFLDVAANSETDITGLSAYEYTFDYIPQKVNGQVTAEENRFFVRIQPLPTGLNNRISGETHVYSKDRTIFAISGSSDLIQKIRVYNTQGVLIYADDNIKAPFYTINCNSNIPEICIVKLITERETKSVKIGVK
jgi:hypothetical protein